MAESSSQLQWTDEQWNTVRQVVYEEARRARVAGNFLPLFGPLAPDANYVPRETLSEDGRIAVDDTSSLKLTTLQQFVYLRPEQVADPALASALDAFRRAASRLARLEDDIIFRGQQGPDKGAPPLETSGTPEKQSKPLEQPAAPAPPEVRGGEANAGLSQRPDNEKKNPEKVSGDMLVAAVSKAISELEGNRHFGPFACALSHDYFLAVQSPNRESLVLPQDRILPFLGGGPLVRTSSLWPRSGVVVALSGAPVDLVVGTDITVNFLQVTPDPLFVFRVFEKMALRIKQPRAIQSLVIEPAS